MIPDGPYPTEVYHVLRNVLRANIARCLQHTVATDDAVKTTRRRGRRPCAHTIKVVLENVELAAWYAFHSAPTPLTDAILEC